MRAFTTAVTCPSCGRSAVITLIEDIDPRRGTEGHDITFRCTTCQFQPTVSDLLKLWAANRPYRDPVG